MLVVTAVGLKDDWMPFVHFLWFVCGLLGVCLYRNLCGLLCVCVCVCVCVCAPSSGMCVGAFASGCVCPVSFFDPWLCWWQKCLVRIVNHVQRTPFIWLCTAAKSWSGWKRSCAQDWLQVSSNSRWDHHWRHHPVLLSWRVRNTPSNSATIILCVSRGSHKSSKVSQDGETFSFILTESDGTKRYGYCRRLHGSGKKNVLDCFCIISLMFEVFSRDC